MALDEFESDLHTEGNELDLDKHLKYLRLAAGDDEFQILRMLVRGNGKTPLAHIDKTLETDSINALRHIHDHSLVTTTSDDGNTVVVLTHLGRIMHDTIVSGVEIEAEYDENESN